MNIEDYSRSAAVILGVSAICCVLSIGGYIIAWSFNIYASDYGSSFLLLAIASWIAVLACTIILIYGTIKIHRKSALRGGLTNTTAGIIMAALWVYFYYGFPLLPQFGLLTLPLFIPALLSAFLGFASFQKQEAQPAHMERQKQDPEQKEV